MGCGAGVRKCLAVIKCADYAKGDGGWLMEYCGLPHWAIPMNVFVDLGSVVILLWSLLLIWCCSRFSILGRHIIQHSTCQSPANAILPCLKPRLSPSNRPRRQQVIKTRDIHPLEPSSHALRRDQPVRSPIKSHAIGPDDCVQT